VTFSCSARSSGSGTGRTGLREGDAPDDWVEVGIVQFASFLIFLGHGHSPVAPAVRQLLRAAQGHGPYRMFARLAISTALNGKPEPPIGNPNDAPPSPKWRNNRKRDAWR
jgi:hypothetical protein